MATTIELRTPIQAHGEERRTIELRDITPADINACGYPFKGDGTIEASAISALISRLGNIPPSSVNQLTIRDWNACMLKVFSFFGDPEGEEEDSGSSNAPSTSPLSGNGTLGPH
jgi:hypothetical protein